MRGREERWKKRESCKDGYNKSKNKGEGRRAMKREERVRRQQDRNRVRH